MVDGGWRSVVLESGYRFLFLGDLVEYEYEYEYSYIIVG
jgi:hypothetical protein